MELKDIQELMKVMKKEELEELKIRYGKMKLTLINSCDASQKINVSHPVKVMKKEEKVKKEEIIKSDNVGKIKLLNVNSGKEVKKGEILAKIYTMGIENEVRATVDGVIKEVLVSDGIAVDFSKELFKIEIK
ncbi:MAG: acetyl-CoA carboxylase biotin carboxyl carrier protein subunit [Leptotrichia sp.]|uniref:biotin/lipoyl-containing protein n=1 Tax=Leptotrichia sp. oral taxon 498 TaxID=712368 RepID=UPI000B8D12ED|nr:biotin/lipoyl-containing protein [Leptotrichia sp. oral taxon 498]ASQ47580.1 acetyl-CoA carboxylase biotin carboxyl carrier protein subunit [Leptotrichia sp. oral taxon 498]RKW36172.1 MAG: acetyl-CoA carboxylase biotin carboxyl carrier protein subunit [Leptotrichia sp.]